MKCVKKNAANYLSKYMSKGAGDVALLGDIVGSVNVPRSWWSMSSAARSMVKREVLTGDAVAWVLDELVRSHIKDGNGWGLRFVRAIEVEVTEYQSVVIGYWGVCEVAMMGELADMIKSA